MTINAESASCPVCNYPHDFENVARADRVIAGWHKTLAAAKAEGAREAVERIRIRIYPDKSLMISVPDLLALLDKEAAR